MSADADLCPTCGARLIRDGRNLCLRCAATALPDPSDVEDDHDDSRHHGGAVPLLDPRRPFGRYTLQACIGRGAMGEVWKAHDPKTGRIVALKVLRAGAMAHPRDVDRFIKEARTAAELQHPSAIAVYDRDMADGMDYFTMEWIDGDSLGDRIRTAPLCPTVAARYVREAASLMAAAHAQGIVHRDLKPTNILVDRDDRARVTDFGLARDLGGEAGLTTANAIVGTPSYMSPEQASGKPVDARSDVYSLGATLYELLTCHPPFGGVTAETLKQVLDEEPIPPRALNRAIPRDLETVCLQCLQKDPRRRYQSASALVTDLQNFLDNRPVEARPTPALVRLRHWAVRFPSLALASALAVAMFLFMVGAAVLFRQDLVQANAFAARGVASSLVLRLREWADHLKLAAVTPELQEVLRAHDPARVQAWLDRWCHLSPLPNDSATLLDPRGIGLARCARRPSFVGEDFSHRDYFRGALRHSAEDPVHVSAVYHSKITQQPRFSLSIAVRDSSGQVLGVLATALGADATLGIVNLQTADRKVVVVGPLDPTHRPGERWPYPSQARAAIVVHPFYTEPPKTPQWTNDWHDGRTPGHDGADLSDQTRARTVRGVYFDPMRSRASLYAGPWLVGVAPIGQTDFVVLVQSRDWVLLSLLTAAAMGCLGFAAMLLRRWRRGRAMAITLGTAAGPTTAPGPSRFSPAP